MKRKATRSRPLVFCVFCEFCVRKSRVRQVQRIQRVLREANLSSAFGLGDFFLFRGFRCLFFRTDFRLNRKFVPDKNGGLKNSFGFWFFPTFAVNSKTSSK